MIINLRGTNGSGKSTIARDLIYAFGGMPEPVKTNAGRTVDIYRLKLPRKPLFVLGSYRNPCGGCDTIKTVDEVIDLVNRCRHHDVLFEGILISTTYGALGAASEAWPGFWYAFLNTPLDQCIARVNARRQKAGNEKPLNEKGLRDKYAVIQRLRFDPRIAPRAVDVSNQFDVLQLLMDRDPILL